MIKKEQNEKRDKTNKRDQERTDDAVLSPATTELCRVTFLSGVRVSACEACMCVKQRNHRNMVTCSGQCIKSISCESKKSLKPWESRRLGQLQSFRRAHRTKAGQAHGLREAGSQRCRERSTRAPAGDPRSYTDGRPRRARAPRPCPPARSESWGPFLCVPELPRGHGDPETQTRLQLEERGLGKVPVLTLSDFFIKKESSSH